MSTKPAAVRIVEVGPRDGLQNVSTLVPTSTKIELINRLHKAGCQTIELTSAVSPKAIPQLADCKLLLSNPSVKALQQQTGLRLPVLVPNPKGLQVAIEYGAREVAVFVSATEGFSKANINCSVEEGLQRARLVAEAATNAGVAVRGYISCIFADPYEGPTMPSAVLHCAQRLLEMGCYEISLGDTLGVGTASDVKKLITFLVEKGIPVNVMAGHFHDTYGQATGNVWQAYQCGVTVFDSSVGGLGGCPFAPGAKGNVATEDLVYMFHQSGIQTGINLDAMADIGVWISKQLSKANDSRAGAALFAKKSLSLQKKESSQKPTSSKPDLVWNPVTVNEELELFRAGKNLKIVLNRPKNGNALTSSMIFKLTDVFTNAQNDKSFSRIIITAKGKFFCTGMDLGKDSSPVARDDTASKAQFERLTKLFDVIDKARQVTIAGINGPAFGGGIGLAFACDIRFAVQKASLTLSEVKLGLSPATISKYVVREWGQAFTREAMLSARPVSVTELKALGVVAHVAPNLEELEQHLDRYVTRLAASAPQASRMVKELVALGYADAGGEKQASGIRRLFEEMMRPDSEAAWGMKQFQKGNRAVNWDACAPVDVKAKL